MNKFSLRLARVGLDFDFSLYLTILRVLSVRLQDKIELNSGNLKKETIWIFGCQEYYCLYTTNNLNDTVF